MNKIKITVPKHADAKEYINLPLTNNLELESYPIGVIVHAENVGENGVELTVSLLRDIGIELLNGKPNAISLSITNNLKRSEEFKNNERLKDIEFWYEKEGAVNPDDVEWLIERAKNK